MQAEQGGHEQNATLAVLNVRCMDDGLEQQALGVYQDMTLLAPDFLPLICRVEDGRGGLGHAATPRFPSPLVKPDVRISRIRLSDWLHCKAHGDDRPRSRRRHRTARSP